MLKKILLLYRVSHELLFSTLWTNNILPICYEAFANHRTLARRADEAIIMPVSTLKRNKSGSTNACNWLITGSTSLREKFTKAISAVGLVISGCESLSRQRFRTVCAGEALSVPGLISVGHTSLSDHFAALDTLGGKLVLVAFCAVDVVLLRDKGLCANRHLTSAADKTLLVPLPVLILHLLHASSENVSTCIASGGKLCVITGSTVNSVCLATKLFIHQRASALKTQETGLMPVLVFVGQIL